MKRLAFLLASVAAIAPAADFLTWRRSGNLFVVQSDEGVAEFEFVTGATFRYARKLKPTVFLRYNADSVAVTPVEKLDRLTLTTQHIVVHLFKQGLQVQVEDKSGKLLAAFTDRAIEKELDIKPHGFFYNMNGYGLSRNKRGDSFFHYGPLPKEILEQRYGTEEQLPQLEPHHAGLLTPSGLPPNAVRLRPAGAPDWKALEATIAQAIELANAGVAFPAWNVSEWDNAAPDVRKRAMQLAALFPLAYATKPVADEAALLKERKRLASFLLTYYWEARQRGFPVIHPTAFQYPNDPEAGKDTSVFLLGDELLIVPITSPATKRSFYLPQGVWTDLATNAVLRGRKRVEIDVPSYLPVYLRNGSILPMDGDPMVLHYTPMLGAELFLYEPAVDDYSQFHASPAGDYVRLEMESKIARRIEWIIHHFDKPAKVEGYTEVAARAALKPGAWFYDTAKRNLHVTAMAAADADVIINIR